MLYDDKKNEFIIDENGMLTAYVGLGGDVIIPDGVTDIFFDVFHSFAIIDTIVIPGSIDDIAPFVFENSTIKVVKINEGVKVIGICSFNCCQSLDTVYLPKSIREINFRAFANCSSLSKIYYGGSQSDWNAIVKEDNWDENTNNYVIEFNYN